MNWIATYYNKNNKIIHIEVFKDRTEHEAENEAMGLMPRNCDDWSLVSKDKIDEMLKPIKQ
jgi:hypothetical protein